MPADELTPAQRTMRARIAANTRIAAPSYDAQAATAPATAGFWAKLEREVDPDQVFTPDVRRRKARALWQVRMMKGKLAASRRRRG